MIPILNEHNRPSGRYKKTLADELLTPYDNDLAITVRADGKDLVVPVWRFIEKYLRIKDRSGRFIPFEINRAQCEFYIKLCEQKRAGKPMRVNILKARQLGFSTFIAAVLFVLTIFVPNQTACIIADTSEHATNLFKKYKFYYANLPEFLKKMLPLIASNAKELTVDYGGGQTSTVRVLVQGENAGRSDTAQYLHLSEVAFWQNIEETTTSILQTVDDTNPNSIIAYETTANGVNYYKEIWDLDTAGDTGYQALFFAWYLDKNNRVPYWDFELLDWEKKLKEKYNLDFEQIAWYRTQYNKMRGNLEKLRQEMPSAPIEAFIVSGNSKFNMELLLERKAELIHEKPLKQGFFTYRKTVNQDGSQINLTDIRWIESERGSIKIYEEPNKGHPYVVANDPANGGEDYFVSQVVNNYTGCQAAVYRKNKCDADDCAYQTYCLLKYYSGSIEAMATGETNTTSYILKLLYKCGYRFIYQDQDVEALSGRYADKFGWKTKQNNRNYMIDLVAENFRDNPKIIRDYTTICEMENFQITRDDRTGKEKIQAIAGAHDDTVMALCGFYLCRHAQKSIPTNIVSQNGVSSIEELEQRVARNRERINKERQERMFYSIWD